jgi:hypothetical protein
MPHIPAAGVGCMAAFLVPFAVAGVWQLADALASTGPMGITRLLIVTVSVVWLSLLVLGVLGAIRRAWAPVAFQASRDAAVLELVERNVLTRRERRETFPLSGLAGLSVETVSGSGPRPGLHAVTPNVRITLRIDDGSRTPRARTVSLHVEGVDRREEVADLAYRLGAASGLAYQRVVRSDVRDIELAISPSMGIGHERIPALEGRADYAANVFSHAALAAAAEERVPPFDPAQFPSDHKVAKWLPGREVTFRRPLGLGLGCLPFAVAALLAGPALFVISTSRRPETALADRLVPSAFLGVFGLFFGVIALSAVVSALPRRVTIDWARQAITIGGLFTRTEIPLADVHAVEARCVRTLHSGGKNKSSYQTYRCEVQAHRRDPAANSKAVVLVQTSEFREDPDTPYRRTLPLVTELAEALGVERRITDYS